MNNRCLNIVEQIVIIYLNKNNNVDSSRAIVEIKNGNTDVLKKHIKVLSNIFDKALKEISKIEDITN